MASITDILGGVARVTGGVYNAIKNPFSIPGTISDWIPSGGGAATPVVGGGNYSQYSPFLPVQGDPYGGSTLGAAEVLVPDVIERAIGTMPDNALAVPSDIQNAIVVQPLVTQRLKAPRNYVIVECPRGSGQKVAMLKCYARHYGYWKPDAKPPISVTDWRHLKRADAAVRRIDRVVKMSNAVVGKKRYKRGGSSTVRRAVARRK